MEIHWNDDDLDCLPTIHTKTWGDKCACLPPNPTNLGNKVSDLLVEPRGSEPERKEKSKHWNDSLTDSDSSSSDEDLPPSRMQRGCSQTVRRGLSRKGAVQDLQVSQPVLHCGIYTDRVKTCFKELRLKPIPRSLKEDAIEEDERNSAEMQLAAQKTGRGRGRKAQKPEPPEVIDADAVQEPVVIDDEEDMLGPPSPPKALLTKKTGRVRMKRGVQKALRELNQAKKSKLNTSVVSDPDDVIALEETSSTLKEEITVKVMYIGVIKKFPMKMWEPFEKIIPEVSKQFGIQREGVTFVFRDRSLSDTDTPNTVGLEIVDIIECHVLAGKPLDEDDDQIPLQDRIELYVQCRNSRQRLRIATAKNRSLRYLMEKYAAKKRLDFTKLRFVFDGDDIGPEDTPTSLDMDNGDCIDAIGG